MPFLYYAGMAADRHTEQIGLAVSTDGRTFERVHGSGLIVPRLPAVPWKALRTCNPTVIRFQGRWLMFYQGVGRGAAAGELTHSIGLARLVSSILDVEMLEAKDLSLAQL